MGDLVGVEDLEDLKGLEDLTGVIDLKDLETEGPDLRIRDR